MLRRLARVCSQYLQVTEVVGQIEREVLNARIHFIYFVPVQKNRGSSPSPEVPISVWAGDGADQGIRRESEPLHRLDIESVEAAQGFIASRCAAAVSCP